MKILIVDDSVFAQKFIEKAILGSFPDAQIITAPSGEDAYELFLSDKPDFIVTDLLMPGMGGQMLIHMIRQTDKDCKIIVVSADVQKSVQEEIMQMHVLKFINKPLNAEKSQLLVSLLEDGNNA